MVTAGRGSDLEKLDVSTTVLTRQEVQAMPETGVDQILNRIPGIWTYTVPTGQLHPTGQPVSIRGFGTTTTINTLVMMDGVPINDPYFRTVDWSRIPKDSVERVEVIRGGGATSLWGNMAMGGVINIVTRQPSKTGAEADVSYGSYNTTNANVGATAAFNDNLKAGVSYNHAQSSGYNLTPAQYQNANLVPTASKADNVDFTLHFDSGSNLKLFTKAYFHQAYEDGWVWSLSHNNWSSYRLLLGGSYTIDDKSSVAFSAWAGGGVYGTINTANGSYTLNNIGATNQYVSQKETAPNADQGGSVFYQFEIGSLKDIKIGVDARRMVISDYNNLYSSATSAPTTFVANGEHRLQGVFGQGTYHFSGVPLEVTIGLRGDFYQALNASVQTVNSGANLPIANSSASSFDPRVGLKFYMTDDLVVRGAVYRNFSAPGMNQMYRSFAGGTTYTTVNPNLQPMTNVGEEIGVDFKWRGFNLSMTYFNNNLDNFIDLITICSANATCASPYVMAAGLGSSFTTVRQYQNVGSATFQGIEIIGGWQPFKELQLTAGFTNTTAYLTSSNFPAIDRTGVQLGQVPTWTVTATAEWRPVPEVALTASLRSFPAYWNDTGHTQLNQGATIIDVGASYSPIKNVDLYASVQNLTNFQYLAMGYTTTTFEGPTVNATAIPTMGMPLTVIAGLRAKF
ncbi:Outer membrane receptor for ferrienterochelin and colicins [Enhydrobacter aerosaccus]|uniref:Outer membrane receptor for ferrienterochelin and colicins n=2 Tax=Enhydrobacter aerosaccus TaxID=225324 RepID=A0A1T4NNZ7_9HYPH|nr:Outer membrane receptor for ferrienterochelin and colicins [Enhydrobacter aerosaccus]